MMSSAEVLLGKYLINRFIRLCVKCIEVEILLVEEFLRGVVVYHTFSCYPHSRRVLQLVLSEDKLSWLPMLIRWEVPTFARTHIYSRGFSGVSFATHLRIFHR
jgi:hypothetical protein